jgi:hypothetical protein
MKSILEKLKSWPMWLALAALAVFLVKTFVHVDIGDTANDFLNYLLPVLVAFGVVNNPNSRDSF